jgi:hypothetical protein
MKNTIPLLTFVIVAAGAAGLSHAAADDLTVVSNLTTNGKPDGTETQYISSEHIRTSRSEGTGMIIDLKTGVMTNIDGKNKTYFEVTKQDLQNMQAMFAERMKDPKMKQAMAMMKGMATEMSSSAEVKKTGVTRKVAGFACDEWLITMSSMMSITECVTGDFKYPVESLQAAAEFSESMRKSMTFGPGSKSSSDYAEKMKSIKGFPVATSTTVDAGITKTTTAMEVTEVRHESLPASTWDAPAGFRKVDNPMLKSLQEHGR